MNNNDIREDEINSRVKIIGSKNDIPIIYLKEFEQQTIEKTRLLWDRLDYLANNNPFYLIADLSTSAIPSSEVRFYVNQRHDAIRHLLLFVYIFIGSNFLFKITAKFMAASARVKNFKVINDIQHGLDLIKNNT